MKTSSFIIWQIKKWIPLFALFIIGSVFILRSSAALISDGTLSFLGIASFVLPFFVFNERFDKTAADAYKAFPANKRQITRIKMLIAAVFIVVLCTVVYLVGIAFYYATYGNENASQLYPYDQFGLIQSGTSYFFLGYLFLIVFELTSFFFNCTLVSLGNYLPSSIVYLSCGNFLLSGFIPTLILLFGGYDGAIELFKHGLGILGMGGNTGKTNFIELTLVQLYPHIEIYAEGADTLAYSLFGVMFAIEVAVGVLSFFMKDPSGEHYAQPGARNELHKIIVYVAIAMCFIIEGVLTSILFKISELSELAFVTFVGVGISVYITFAIYNKRFKLTKNEMIVLGVIAGGALVIKMVYAFLPLPNGITDLDYLFESAQMLLK